VWDLLFNIWAECTPPITQAEWMQEPADKMGLEYVIYKLLLLDPLERWTPTQAYHFLQQLPSSMN
jgi:hypothetical protein